MNTKALLWAVLLGFAFILSGAEARAAQDPGRIIARGVKGRVTAREKAADASVNPLTVVKDTELRQGMVVTTETNSSVVLIFANGAVVNLGAESVLDIDTFTMEPTNATLNPDTITDEPTVSKTKINLTKGELVGKVAKLKKAEGSEFTVGTPVGAAGIRGTTFRIVYRPGTTGQAFFSLTTVEGNVEVTLANQTVPAAVVGANQEVVLANVTVNVDNTTGQVTIILPAGTSPAVVQATAAATQLVLVAVQSIVEATAGVSMTANAPIIVVEPPPPPKDPVPDATPAKKTTTSGDGL